MNNLALYFFLLILEILIDFILNYILKTKVLFNFNIYINNGKNYFKSKVKKYLIK